MVAVSGQLEETPPSRGTGYSVASDLGGVSNVAAGSSAAAATAAFVRVLGVPDLPPATTPFDPGYDLRTLEGHLEQSHHLMDRLKLSMACWLVADERVTRAKLAAAHRFGVSVLSGGGPFEIAAAQGRLPDFLDLCAGLGFDEIEAGSGFTDLAWAPQDVVTMAHERGLGVQFELGDKHSGPFAKDTVVHLIEQGRAWLDAGAQRLVVEARESAAGVGLFDPFGQFNAGLADQLVDAFGFTKLTFEAPSKASQFALLDHFGPTVILTNVRLEEVLRVEIYRRGLHSDAFLRDNLRPAPLAGDKAETA